MDSNGWLLQVLVHPAYVQERDGARLLLEQMSFPLHRLELIWCDAGYWGAQFPQWVQEHCGVRLEVISRNQLVNRQREHKGYVPLPRRWVVERTFAWWNKWRRLSKDYEQNPRSSEAWILLVMTALMLNRLT